MQGRDIRQAQDRNGLHAARIAAQLGEPTVRTPQRRVFGGPLALPAPGVARSTTLEATRLALQGTSVVRQLSFGNAIAGPGTIT